MNQEFSQKELPNSQISIRNAFWSPRLQINARKAIFHQWRQLEQSRCIDNFRLAAGEKEGFREGWFFADSDAYKWLDAAARILVHWPSEDLRKLTDDFIALLGRAQMEDGYLYTYNQIHFPSERWGNLMIEHELYCHGHLIEAGVSHFEATGMKTALQIAIKAADLLVRDFLQTAPFMTSGHEEIEIALLRLYQVTSQEKYQELAQNLLERRGKTPGFALSILQQNARVAQREQIVQEQRKSYQSTHPDLPVFQLPENNYAKKPLTSKLRWMVSALGGKYFQQHAPIRKQTVPVGHSVRFTYLETATAMLYRLNGDASLLPALQKAWERMVVRRMYVTGGIGSLPDLEGFGRDDELDPETAYAETCAALGSLFWNWEMALATGDARYSDLFEWQLYNAAAVGMGLDGENYLYNNPLLCRGGVTRRPWFKVPCCPSNLSRTWSSLGKYVYSYDRQNLWIHQFVGNQANIPETGWRINMESSLPWEGTLRLTLDVPATSEMEVHLRIPAWAGQAGIKVNGKSIEGVVSDTSVNTPGRRQKAANGYDPRTSRFVNIRRSWSAGDVIEMDLEMPITALRPAGRLRNQRGKVALTRGPLVYCLESVDNPEMDIFKVKIDLQSVRVESEPDMLGGIRVLRGKTSGGQDFTAIPYHLWANRGKSTMTVWLKG